MLPHVVEIGNNFADVPVEQQLSLDIITLIKLFAGIFLFLYSH